MVSYVICGVITVVDLSCYIDVVVVYSHLGVY